MNKKRKMLLSAIVVLQVVTLIFLYRIHSSMEYQSYTMQNQSNEMGHIKYELDHLDNKIGNLKDNIERSESLIGNSYTEIGKIDLYTLTYPVTFFVTPKEYTVNTKVYLLLNGEKLPLTKENDVFKYTMIADAKKEYAPQEIIIENNGVYQSQKVSDREDLYVDAGIDHIFPEIDVLPDGYTIYPDFSKGASVGIYYDTKCRIYIYNKNKKMGDNLPITIKDMKYQLLINDKVIEEQKFKKDDSESTTCYRTENEKKERYPMKKGDIFKAVVKLTFEKGFTYEKVVYYYDTMTEEGAKDAETNAAKPEREAPIKETMEDYTVIKDKNGNILFEGELW